MATNINQVVSVQFDQPSNPGDVDATFPAMTVDALILTTVTQVLSLQFNPMFTNSDVDATAPALTILASTVGAHNADMTIGALVIEAAANGAALWGDMTMGPFTIKAGLEFITIKQVAYAEFNFLNSLNVDQAIAPFTMEGFLQNVVELESTVGALTVEAQGAHNAELTIGALVPDMHLQNITELISDTGALTITATGLTGSISTADMTIGAPTADATGYNPNLFTGDMTIGALVIEASNMNIGTADMVFPRFQSTITGSAGKIGNVDLNMAAFTIDIRMGSGVEVSTPAFTIEAVLTTGAVGNLTESAGAFQIEAAGTVGGVASIDATVAALTLEAQHFQTNQGSADMSTVALVMQASHIQGQVLTSITTISALTLEATGFNPNIGTVDAIIGAFIMDAHAHPTFATYVKSLALNLRNLSNTEYVNYPFDDMALLGETQIGVNSNGLYSLSGATDIGTAIDNIIQFGYYDTNNEVIERLVNSYLSARTDDALQVSLITEGSAARPFAVTFFQDELNTRRVKFPRDMKDRYYSYQIENQNGGELELHKIDLETITVKEKV
jgi:hypothetical protein